MKVVLLTEPEKNSLVGELVQPYWYFNPVLDCNDNWIITEEELQNSIYVQHEWIQSMPLIEWCAPVRIPIPLIN